MKSTTYIHIPYADECFDIDYVEADDMLWTMNYQLNCGYAFDRNGQYIYRFVYPETLSPKPLYIAHYQGEQFWIVSESHIYLVEMGPPYASVSNWNTYQ